MALPFRSRMVPQCASCLRGYAFGSSIRATSPAVSLPLQQVRGGKQKLSKEPIVPVRLKQDVETYGPAGSIVPVYVRVMQKEWEPQGIAEYILKPQLRAAAKKGNKLKRDYTFGVTLTLNHMDGGAAAMTSKERADASAFGKAREPAKMTAARAAELVEIFVPPRLDFHRERIAADSASGNRRQSSAGVRGGAAADLLAARQVAVEAARLDAIHGSVSTHDVLIAVRRALEENEEAARVVIQEPDIQFVGLPRTEGEEAETDRVKKLGDYTVEIRLRGSEAVVRRPLKVMPRAS